MLFRRLETSLHRIDQCRFQIADYEFTETFAYLKHHFRDFVQVAFSDTQDAENEFVWHSDTLKYRFSDIRKVFYKDPPEGIL
jgi:hypothetical protein